MRTASSPAEASTLLALLHTVADAVATALAASGERGLAGARPGQYRADLIADAAALGILTDAGVDVLSEESGLASGPGGLGVVVVVDPLDGSTNADRGVPWYATSLCAVDGDGPVAAVVADLARDVRFEATRGGGARVSGGQALVPSGCSVLGDAIVGLSGWPPMHFGWGQYRCLGAAALDLCAVAAGVLDGYVDCSTDAHGPWDYLGGVLVCREAGAAVTDALGRELTVVDHAARRTPVAAATPALLDGLLAARRAFA
ncbi:MAG TPA: inositol monophosphatase family protein [Acidimicrobiales bacterium]|nr:inositol monophosphatase family protein [Acidimicrobiales bacterium]